MKAEKSTKKKSKAEIVDQVAKPQIVDRLAAPRIEGTLELIESGNPLPSAVSMELADNLPISIGGDSTIVPIDIQIVKGALPIANGASEAVNGGKAPSLKSLKSRRVFDSKLAAQVVERIEESKRVRRLLQPWGRISIDRQLPFLCVYRKHEHHTPGDERLVMGESAYISAPGDREHHDNLSSLITSISSQLSKKFGAFLIVEIWVSPFRNTLSEAASAPHFRVVKPPASYPQLDHEPLKKALKRINVQKQSAHVQVTRGAHPHPPGTMSLVSMAEARKKRIFVVGIEVSDVYRDSDTNQIFPLIRQKIWRELSRAIQQMCFEFTQEHTTYRPANYQALGRRSLVKAVWDVDAQLAEISKAFDLVLAVTPTNAANAWRQFKRRNFEQEPKFLYRPVAVDLRDLKRKLYSINIDKVDDPALAQLYFSQQRGIDSKITLLLDRSTRRFLYGSMQLYGVPTQEHLNLARHILSSVPPTFSEDHGEQSITPEEFAQCAEAELDYYRGICPDFPSHVEMRSDIAGVMVSDGNLLVSSQSNIPKNRVFALLQHEIGTHIVTYYNGKSQPFKQLYTGLVGYDELQEGFAVLAEYLSGGLTPARLRMLAGRVIAVQMRIEGAAFVETFRALTNGYGFGEQMAFNLAMRVYRGGGFTKDAVYLRGLIWLLEYFNTGGDAEILLCGKMAKEQIPLIRELRWRKVVKAPILIPRYLTMEETQPRLDSLRTGLSLLQLCRQQQDE